MFWYVMCILCNFIYDFTILHFSMLVKDVWNVMIFYIIIIYLIITYYYYLVLKSSFTLFVCRYIYIYEVLLYSLLGKSQAQHDVHSTLSGSYSIRCAWEPADYWRTSCSIHSHDPWTFMFTQVVLFWMSLPAPPQTSPNICRFFDSSGLSRGPSRSKQSKVCMQILFCSGLLSYLYRGILESLDGVYARAIR